jgi:hypothetical protein
MLFDVNSLVTEPKVKVTSTLDRTEFKIAWLAQPGATGYRVYAGFDPLHIRSLISGVAALPASPTEFSIVLRPTPPNQLIYFWVRTIDGVSDPFIDEVGSHVLITSQLGHFEPFPLSDESRKLICAEDQQFFFEEIRRRARAILEDSGEDVDVFIRQWTGLPDATTQDALALDPNYQGMTRDDNTFGTGFFPGFFPAIRLKMRFGALPAALFDFQMPGFRPLLENEAWTSHEPLLHENDLLVRVSTGQRYVPKSVAFSNYRGTPITQRMNVNVVQPNSPLFKITDPLVRQKWTQVNAVEFIRTGFGISADPSGGPDFLLLR